VMAVAISAQKPRVAVILHTVVPRQRITLWLKKARPTTMPIPPEQGAVTYNQRDFSNQSRSFRE